LYARVVAKNPKNKGIAVGHAMRKLLHLVFAVWKTGKPFDPNHYPWEKPTHVAVATTTTSVTHMSQEQAASLKPVVPAQKEVIAAHAPSIPHEPKEQANLSIDFAHVKRQLSMQRVLDQLGLTAKLRGSGPQRKGACPIHRGDQRGRTFSVNLDEQVFYCHHAACGRKGDVIDLWASVNGMSLREAAIDLVHTFSLEPRPMTTEKRHG
jgi:hypothetical protein